MIRKHSLGLIAALLLFSVVAYLSHDAPIAESVSDNFCKFDVSDIGEATDFICAKFTYIGYDNFAVTWNRDFIPMKTGTEVTFSGEPEIVIGSNYT